MSFVKADGARIEIRFTEPITTDAAQCDPAAFTVSGQEYNYVPNGTLEPVSKTVSSVSNKASYVATVELSAGTLSGTMVSEGLLMLEVDDG